MKPYTSLKILGKRYYPGGMDMPGRGYFTSSNANYRYGFNGKEKDKESPVQYDYGFRIYDPRLVRFKSVDPLQAKHPGESPYLFVGGNPLLYIDLDGRDRIVSFYALTAKGERVLINRTTYKASYEVTYGINKAIHFGNDGHYYQADIEQTVILDLASGKIVDNYRREGVTKPISMADYYWGADKKPSMSQSTGEGSYQDYGYSITGNSNGENIDFIDKAGENLGSINAGGLLDLLSVAGADPGPIFESFDKSGLENILTGLEKIKATKETQEVIKIIKENATEMLENKGGSPATSSANTKQATAQAVKTSTQKAVPQSKTKGTPGKSTEPDSIFIREYRMNGKIVPSDSPFNDDRNKTIANPNKRKGGN